MTVSSASRAISAVAELLVRLDTYQPVYIECRLYTDIQTDLTDGHGLIAANQRQPCHCCSHDHAYRLHALASPRRHGNGCHGDGRHRVA